MSHESISFNLVKSYGIGASVTGLIQSIAWLVLCILGILYYTDVINHEFKDNEFSIYLLEYDDFVKDKVYVKQQDFMIIIGYYLAVSLIWYVSSVYFCIVVFRNKWHQSKYSIVPWTLITAIVTVSDLVVVGLFGADLNKITGQFNDVNDSFPLEVSYYLKIFLAGRGFVLWFLNLTYVILFTRLIFRDYFNKSSDMPMAPDTRDKSHIQAFNENNFEKRDQASSVFEQDDAVKLADRPEVPQQQTHHKDRQDAEFRRRSSAVSATFSSAFLVKLNQTHVSHLPRAPYISHKELRPITPPPDYSPSMDRRYAPMSYRKEYEPLKY